MTRKTSWRKKQPKRFLALSFSILVVPPPSSSARIIPQAALLVATARTAEVQENALAQMLEDSVDNAAAEGLFVTEDQFKVPQKAQFAR